MLLAFHLSVFILLNSYLSELSTEQEKKKKKEKSKRSHQGQDVVPLSRK